MFTDCQKTNNTEVAAKLKMEQATVSSEADAEANVLYDDVYSIRGEASGTVKYNDKTLQWSSVIVEPIIRKFTCSWAVKEQIKITRHTNTSLFDYGNGSCDDQATLTINGQVHNITLH